MKPPMTFDGVKRIDTDANTLNVNVSGIEPGIYFEKIHSANNVDIRKLVIDYIAFGSCVTVLAKYIPAG